MLTVSAFVFALAASPASMAELVLSSEGARMNGLLYRPAADGPRPLVLLLHGMPGNERNLDLGQAARAAGYNVLFFHPRGMWGSAGRMSFANGLQDVDAVLRWARQPEIARQYGIDPARIALIGHSYGGWLALQTAARQPPAVCAAGLAAWNAGLSGKRFADHPDEKASRAAAYALYAAPEGGMLRTDSAALMEELWTQREAYDYQAQAPALARHPLLLVAATRDSAVSGPAALQPLAAAVRAAGGQADYQELDDDHGFNNQRPALIARVLAWLARDCFR
ncbi:S9 family peptidase [Massilia sp. TS11]|uniref:alpha/beta hydrolase family protein n=1 Tax=Massilia sp. TS11 TaxID=2908003 RepID=UPI001EDBCB41|nr:alpha/beta fold hydrolase [Massilia sp. TS11]MCG2586757.1 alpha/beta fold hydrolase [Massilia sp. TS11]